MPISNSHKIIDQIKQHLFSGEERRVQNWIDRLCKENQEVSGQTGILGTGFLYMGVFYRPSWLERGNWPKPAVHHSMYDKVDLLVKDRQMLLNDKQFISQTLFKLISPCNDFQDLRDALPDCLASIVPDLQSLRRIKPEAFTILEDSRAMRQYRQMLPKIQLYTAARLIY